jgi:hypothetical protein
MWPTPAGQPRSGIAPAAGNCSVTFSCWMFAELSAKNEEYGNKCGHQASTDRPSSIVVTIRKIGAVRTAIPAKRREVKCITTRRLVGVP